MKVLICCEFSATIRDAFRTAGHDAWSCDLLPCEGDAAYHYQEDCRDTIKREAWDLMIAHPPCTYLSNAGIGWFNVARYGDKALKRIADREAALKFFLELYNAPIPRVCIENPVGYVNTAFRKPDQIINPYQFGHKERKRTCLWLRDLPLLVPTNIVTPEEPAFRDSTTGKRRYFVDSKAPHKDRWKARSVSFSGVGKAMANQWDF